jgi:hypothetical protein
MKVILKDKQYTSEFDLTSGQSYSFSSSVVNSTDRFSLIFRTSGVTTGIEDAVKLNTQVFVNANNQITIIAPEKATYSIYNAVGIILENGVVYTKHQTINAKLTTGVYVVCVSDNGRNYSTRLILNGK